MIKKIQILFLIFSLFSSCMRDDKICDKISKDPSISDSRAIELISLIILKHNISGQRDFNPWVNDSCKNKIRFTLYITDKEEPLTKFDNIYNFKEDKIHWLAEKMIPLFYYCKKRNLFFVRIKYYHKVVLIPKPRITDEINLLDVSLDIDQLETIVGWDNISPFQTGRDLTTINSYNRTIEDIINLLNIEYDGTGGIFLK